METPRVVRKNLGYALLGGPALAVASFVAGAGLFDTAAGVAGAVATYALGWALSARRTEAAAGQSAAERSASDADGDRDRREREAEAGKGGYGGGGGG